MDQGFEQWSAANLGQWHYVFGYLIVLISHNWPIILAVVLFIIFGIRLYAEPTRARVAWLFTAFLLGLAYEYEKHIAGELHQAIDFLFGLEISAWNRPLHLLVGPGMNTVFLLAFFAMLIQAVRLSFFSEERQHKTARRRSSNEHVPAERP